MDKLRKWLEKQGIAFEINGDVTFVKAQHSEQVIKYVSRFQPQLKMEFRASYTWLAILKGAEQQ
ncbi:hypothetical protein D1872_90200 [compost metagenome]